MSKPGLCNKCGQQMDIHRFFEPLQWEQHTITPDEAEWLTALVDKAAPNLLARTNTNYLVNFKTWRITDGGGPLAEPLCPLGAGSA